MESASAWQPPCTPRAYVERLVTAVVIEPPLRPTERRWSMRWRRRGASEGDARAPWGWCAPFMTGCAPPGCSTRPAARAISFMSPLDLIKRLEGKVLEIARRPGRAGGLDRAGGPHGRSAPVSGAGAEPPRRRHRRVEQYVGGRRGPGSVAYCSRLRRFRGHRHCRSSHRGLFLRSLPASRHRKHRCCVASDLCIADGGQRFVMAAVSTSFYWAGFLVLAASPPPCFFAPIQCASSAAQSCSHLRRFCYSNSRLPCLPATWPCFFSEFLWRPPIRLFLQCSSLAHAAPPIPAGFFLQPASATPSFHGSPVSPLLTQAAFAPACSRFLRRS